MYLHATLAGLEARIPAKGAVIFPMIERALGTRIAWIRQRIEARSEAASVGRALTRFNGRTPYGDWKPKPRKA